jgi:hypothetical protein
VTNLHYNTIQTFIGDQGEYAEGGLLTDPLSSDKNIFWTAKVGHQVRHVQKQGKDRFHLILNVVPALY